MSIIVPHNVKVQGHSALPYLWRATCSCGWSAIAGSQERAEAAKRQHILEEEPFPDLNPEELRDD